MQFCCNSCAWTIKSIPIPFADVALYCDSGTERMLTTVELKTHIWVGFLDQTSADAAFMHKG